MQGEVYGKRIIEAKPSSGSISAIKKLVEKGFDIKITKQEII